MPSEIAQKVLDFIKEFHRKNGASPSFREIQKYFGYQSVRAVQKHVEKLREEGLLTSPRASAGKHRRLIPKEFNEPPSIPIYGEIAAGSPRPTEQVELGRLAFQADHKTKNYFALRVSGDSMIDVGILEGDFVIVDPKAKIEVNDIVVALVDGEPTIKRLIHEANEAFLKPENQRLKKIPLRGKNVSLQGKVVESRRNY